MESQDKGYNKQEVYQGRRPSYSDRGSGRRASSASQNDIGGSREAPRGGRSELPAKKHYRSSTGELQPDALLFNTETGEKFYFDRYSSEEGYIILKNESGEPIKDKLRYYEASESRLTEESTPIVAENKRRKSEVAPPPPISPAERLQRLFGLDPDCKMVLVGETHSEIDSRQEREIWSKLGVDVKYEPDLIQVDKDKFLNFDDLGLRVLDRLAALTKSIEAKVNDPNYRNFLHLHLNGLNTKQEREYLESVLAHFLEEPDRQNQYVDFNYAELLKKALLEFEQSFSTDNSGAISKAGAKLVELGKKKLKPNFPYDQARSRFMGTQVSRNIKTAVVPTIFKVGESHVNDLRKISDQPYIKSTAEYKVVYERVKEAVATPGS